MFKFSGVFEFFAVECLQPRSNLTAIGILNTRAPLIQEDTALVPFAQQNSAGILLSGSGNIALERTERDEETAFLLFRLAIFGYFLVSRAIYVVQPVVFKKGEAENW